MRRIYLFLFLCFTLGFCTRVPAQVTNKPWTEADRQDYAHRNDNPANWDTTMLAEDLESHREPPHWPTGVAIASIPSPVAPYRGYAALRVMELEIAGKTVTGWNVAYARDSFRLADFTEPDAYYQSYFTLLVVTDWPQTANRAAHIISRNYPHYMATGKYRTSTGDLDWVHMHLAGGDNFAVVSQRYFDLTQGRTVLAEQQEDGSLRLRQIDASPGAVNRKGEVVGLEAYYRQLAEDPDVQAFFE